MITQDLATILVHTTTAITVKQVIASISLNGVTQFGGIAHCGKEQTMSRCYACGETIRRGYPMVTNKGEKVIICERCKRLLRKAKAEEVRMKGAEDE